MTGITTHLRTAHSFMSGDAGRTLGQMFESLAMLAYGQTQPVLPGFPGYVDELQIPSYSTVHRNIEILAPQVIKHASLTRLRLIFSLRKYYPHVGRRWLQDGTDYAAWVLQRGTPGGRGSAEDLKLRGTRTPYAGHRASSARSASRAARPTSSLTTARCRSCASTSSRTGAACSSCRWSSRRSASPARWWSGTPPRTRPR
jgi:hypothetical protein